MDSVGEGKGGMFRKNSMYIIYSETDRVENGRILKVGSLGDLVESPCSLRDFQQSSPIPLFRSINSSVLFIAFFIVQLTSIHDYWKNDGLN